MSAFVIIYKADIGELCVHYIVLKLLAQKNWLLSTETEWSMS